MYFKGTMSWDPGLANNNSNIYDSRRVEVKVPVGTTNATFPRFLIDNIATFGIWNLYGSHDAKFEHYPDGRNSDDNTRIVGGTFGPGRAPLEDDGLVGLPVSLNGKLVDLDPEAVWNSQIYFDHFMIGDNNVGISAPRSETMHSRWINFRRNLDRLDIAGAAGVVWQTVFPKESLTFQGLDRSKLLQEFKRRLDDDPTVQGLMLRFSTYRTLYFQNGLFNNTTERPRDVAELMRLHQEGKSFSNPAYSRLIGVIGLWNQGEPSTWPGGRFLIPAGAMPATTVGGTPVSIGPAVAEVVGSRLILDFLHTIPEANRALDKVNLGDLIVSLQDGEYSIDIGRITSSQYGRSEYERNAGIIELPLSMTGWITDRLAKSDIVISGISDGNRVPLLVERRFNAVANHRDLYLNKDELSTTRCRVFDRGQTPTEAMRLVVGRYEGLTRTSDPVVELAVSGDGAVDVPLQHSVLGPIDYGMEAFPTGSLTPDLPSALDITAGQFFSTRTLPVDTELTQGVTDAQLTWDFIYNTVLRHWDLTNPIMSLRGIPLNDQKIMESLASAIINIIDDAPEMLSSTRAMPITRDLSKGKRELLRRWAALHE
jgi:hypothetical protein